MWHPNIYKNGEVCISILHPPEIDFTTQQIHLGNYTATPTLKKCAVCPYIAFCDDAMI